MKCPRCGNALAQRIATGITAFVCQEHGVWQEWPAMREQARRAQAADAERDTNLIEGFIWGRIL